MIAYRTAAKAVRDSSVSIMGLAREGKVTSVPGIGKTLEEKLRALDETGDIPSAVKLRAKFPAGLVEMTKLPGFGAKRARQLYDALGVDSLEALRAAAEQNKVRDVKGFGPKGEENLLKALAAHEEAGGAGRGARRALAGAPDRRADRRPRCASIPPPTRSRSRARPAAGATRSRTSTSSRRRATPARWSSCWARSSSSSRSSRAARRARAWSRTRA